jgi:peroxiredoxin Q/BCP
MDSVDSHKKFASKYNLNFPLLADTEATVSKAYGAWAENQFQGNPGIKRVTFLIDPDGDIAKHYAEVDPIKHATEILQDFEELNAELT